MNISFKDSEKYLSEKQQGRSFTIGLSGTGSREIDEEKRTVSVKFSSEEPYLRHFGYEVLDHSPGAVDLGRLKEAGAVLVDHDITDVVGRVESVSIDKDRVGRALLRFGRGERATEVFNDIADGIRSSISVGYQVLDMVLDSQKDDSEPVYIVKKWLPLEISFVAIPADSSCGVGKSFEPKPVKEAPIMDPIVDKEVEVKAAAPAVHVEPVDTAAIAAQARKDEMGRIQSITSMSSKHSHIPGVSEVGEQAIAEGKTTDQFRELILEKMDEHNGRQAGAIPEIGISQTDARKYSFMNVLRYLSQPNNESFKKAAKRELDISMAAQEASGMQSRGVMIPPDIMRLQARDLNATGTATEGGNTVSTEMLSLIEILRNRSAVAQMGATFLGGLEGNIAIPRQTGAATAGWAATEGADANESQQAFDQVALTPKTVHAFAEYTRQLLIQSSLDVENMVRNDLMSVLALAIDLAALHGTGANGQPTGIALQTGVNTPGYVSGAAPTFAEIVGLETAVAVDNADVGSMGYLVNATRRGYLKTTEKFSGSNGLTIWEQGNTVNGYRCGVSNQVAANKDFFGNWAELIIAQWGGLDMLVNPYAKDISGGVRISAHQSADIGVRHPTSFAYGTQ